MTDDRYDGTSDVSSYVDITQNNHGGNPESQAANVDVAPRKPRYREIIADWFRLNGPAIAEDVLAAFPKWRYSTVTARISELRRDRIIVQIGVRPTAYSGKDAALLKFREPGDDEELDEIISVTPPDVFPPDPEPVPTPVPTPAPTPEPPQIVPGQRSLF